jgi:hypothetical protein
MIKFSLQCDQGHAFESWFASGASYDSQRKRKLIDCPMCCSQKIDKQLMAPAVRTGSALSDVATPMAAGMPDAELRQKIRALHEEVKANTVDVGERFTEEARKMHSGEIDDRPIRGRASLADASALLSEGVPVLPLPALPDDLN